MLYICYILYSKISLSVKIISKISVHLSFLKYWVSQVVLVVKNLPANAGDVRHTSLIPGWGRSPGGGHGNALQYCCLESPMDREAWQVAIHKFAELDITEVT